MIYIRLFLAFLEIGAVSFGGGYGMISLIREKVLANSWLTESDLLSFIAVSESTPGPIAVNMATFIGYSQGGVLGAICATLGVILPSFIIILIIAMFINNLLKHSGVKAFVEGIKPAIVALIFGTTITMGLKLLLSYSTLRSTISIDWRSLAILGIIATTSIIWGKVRKKSISPILLIIIAAILGIIFFN